MRILTFLKNLFKPAPAQHPPRRSPEWYCDLIVSTRRFSTSPLDGRRMIQGYNLGTPGYVYAPFKDGCLKISTDIAFIKGPIAEYKDFYLFLASSTGEELKTALFKADSSKDYKFTSYMLPSEFFELIRTSDEQSAPDTPNTQQTKVSVQMVRSIHAGGIKREVGGFLPQDLDLEYLEDVVANLEDPFSL
jgi:hypothetical protein